MTTEPPNPTGTEQEGQTPPGERRSGGSPAPAICVENVSKCFRIYRNPWSRVAEWVSWSPRVLHQPFWAVRGVSFEVGRGECLGIIGVNGAGKSTLLKIVTGAMHPTEGRVRVRGRLLSLIELGTGINQQLTGRENVYNLARLLAFPRGFARAHMDRIEAFADIGDFFDRPVSLYSSGMQARLAFAIFASFEPDVLIVDEVLSVGDVFFRQKCASRLREMLDNGLTMLFVSHDTSAILNLCTRALLLEHGRPAFLGDPEGAVSRYQAALTGPKNKWKRGGRHPKPDPAPTRRPDPADPVQTVLRHNVIREGAHERLIHDGSLRIVALRVTDEHDRDTFQVEVGRPLVFRILVEAIDRVDHPTVGLVIHDRLNNPVFGGNTVTGGGELPRLEGGQRALVELRVSMNVQGGDYSLQVGASRQLSPDGPTSERQDLIVGLGPIVVRRPEGARRTFWGMTHLPHTARVSLLDEPALAGAAEP